MLCGGHRDGWPVWCLMSDEVEWASKIRSYSTPCLANLLASTFLAMFVWGSTCANCDIVK